MLTCWILLVVYTLFMIMCSEPEAWGNTWLADTDIILAACQDGVCATEECLDEIPM